MRIPKRYGVSKIDTCPFCDRQATAKNPQQVPVCSDHKDEILPELTCVCGEPLDLMHGKFGAYCHCINCGNMNLSKALELNPQINFKYRKEAVDVARSEKRSEILEKGKETFVRSDELDFI